MIKPLLDELLDKLEQGVRTGMHAHTVGLEAGPVRDAVLENLRHCERLLRQARRWVAADQVVRLDDVQEAALAGAGRKEPPQ